MSNFPDQLLGFSLTEYLTIFVGLIFALAMGEFFISIGGLIRHRQHVRFYWEYVVWLVLILDLFIVSWFTGWPRLSYISEGLFNYCVIIIPYLVVYIIVAIYFPESPSTGEVDLKSHFRRNRKLFFLLWSGYIFMNGLLDLFMPVGYQYFLPIEFLFTALLLVAAFYDKVWYRILLAVIIFGDLIGAMAALRVPHAA